ncbi:hypothetical protein OIU77_010248 [Salix suchowensis]|uniref:CRM domain-containing protein n=1 Tax=Salix suchowensis TaxID=1278906 RepID=A0ABQ9A9X2_9ROSI|nr:hypothetical protein OIU77_010248 [Salix suchowensis]
MRHLSSSTASSKLHDIYCFKPPPSLSPEKPQASNNNNNNKKKQKPEYRPPSSLETNKKPLRSDLPFDFRFSYTESSPDARPIGLREPKYSPFGPGRLDRTWTGVCAPAVDLKVKSVDVGVGEEGADLEEKRRVIREKIQGKPLTKAERRILAEKCQRNKTKRQINLGRDGLTHNMLNDIHNHWKHDEVVRVKCMGVPTVNMKNVCTQLEDKTFGTIIHRHCGLLVLYRGRNYHPRNRPVIPLMLWKPHEPVYPRLIKTTIDGLSIEETKEMRKRGLAVPALTRLSRNGYYGSLVPMVRDAFLVSELVRIDCQGLDRSDHKKIGCKLRDLVPCILVTFDKEQIVVWRGKDYKPPEDEDEQFFADRQLFDDPQSDMDCSEETRSSDETSFQQE